MNRAHDVRERGAGALDVFLVRLRAGAAAQGMGGYDTAAVIAILRKKPASL